MQVVTYNPGMQIVNTHQLAKETGCRYLEVMVQKDGPLIAVQWRRVAPKQLDKGRALIEFAR